MWILDRPIAHRGLHNEEFSENSVGAFKNAIENNYIIETDVHLIKTGEVIAFHDHNTKRMCKNNKRVCDLTIDDIKGDDYLLPDGSHIPLFSELLELAEGKVGIMLELKISPKVFGKKLEKSVYSLIKGKESWVAVQAFDPRTIIWFKYHAPEFIRGMLSANIIFHFTRFLRYLADPHFLSYDINGVANESVQKNIKRHHYPVLTWTIRTEEKLEKAYSQKVDNIIFETIKLPNNSFKK